MNSGPSPQNEKGNMPMIVWDGLGLSMERSGVGVNGAMLYQALKELGCVPYVLSFADETLSYVSPDRALKLANGTNPLWDRFLKLKPIYPICSYRSRKELWPELPVIFHGLSNINLPVGLSKKPTDRFVISIHDIIPLNVNRLSPLAIQMSLLLPRVIARADKIITGSYWTKIQLMERYGLGLADKIHNIAYGTLPPPETFKSSSATKSIDGLSIARGEDYKRLDFLVSLAERRPFHQFALVTDELGQQMVANAPKNLQVLSRQTRLEIETLYRKARVMIHPSLYEGWCLPVADALMRGLFVLYCKGSGIDEVTSFGAKGQTLGLPREAKIEDWISSFDLLVNKDPITKVEAKLPKWSEIGQKTLKIYKSLL